MVTLLWTVCAKVQFESNSQRNRLSGALVPLLWTVCAKVQFESNSQLSVAPRFSPWRCGLSVQRYNLKATHNKRCILICSLWLWTVCAKVQFESNSQPATPTRRHANGCGLSVQRYNLKATHNSGPRCEDAMLLWTVCAKVQFESNSQRIM